MEVGKFVQAFVKGENQPFQGVDCNKWNLPNAWNILALHKTLLINHQMNNGTIMVTGDAGFLDYHSCDYLIDEALWRTTAN